jgi:hypothetical protein
LLAAFAVLFLAIHLRRPLDAPQVPEAHHEEDREPVHHPVHFSEPAS